MGLWYSKDSGFELISYSDADLAGCNDDCKSTSGGIQFLEDKLVSWSSKKQDCTAMSTAEADIPHGSTSNSSCLACPNIPYHWEMQQLCDASEYSIVDEDYHSIKDDTPLVSVYTIGNVLVRGMLIPDEFLTEEIRATNNFKEYETVFVGVDVLMNLPQPVVSTQGTHRSTPRAHRTPTISTASPQGKKRKLEKEKKHDDDEKIDEVVMEKDDDDVEKVDGGVKEKRNADAATGSMEFRKEKMLTPIPSPIRSSRKVSSSNKTVTEELTNTVSPITATTSKDSSTSKRKKRPISYKTKILLGSIDGMCRRRGQIRSHIKNKSITRDFFMGKIRKVLDHCNKVVPELTFAKTNEMINKEMPRLVNLAVNKDCEHTTLNIYPTTSSSTAGKSTTDLQQQLYLKMKSTPQDQAVDLEL
ncbi:hypothetical protein Tco_1334671 [Tanacetum coccineum]